MKNALGLVIVLGLAAAPAMAQKVTIDYAHDFDFSSVKTFQYTSTDETNTTNPMMDDRIESMIKKQLTEGGLQEVKENPDIQVTYHMTTKDQKSFTTTGFGYGGRWGGWGGWGGMGGMSTTMEQDYTEGTLIIDAYDTQEKKMIWRGTGTVTVKEKPDKQVQQVEKILTKLGAKWQKILAGQGK